MRKTILFVAISLVLAWVSAVWGFYFIKSATFLQFIEWAHQNLVIYITVLIFFKFLSTLYPPLPSSILTLSAIPVIGWFNAYLIDYAGSIMGSSISYYIARKYGIRALNIIFEKRIVDKLTKFKVKKGKEIESVIVLRMLIGGTLIEAINYGAGLLNVPYNKFIIGFLISHPLLGIPTFYLVNNLLDRTNLIISMVIILSGFVLLYFLRNRYFEVAAD